MICSSGRKYHQHIIIRELFSLTKWLFVYFFNPQTITIKWLFVHVSGNINSIYGNNMAMLIGSLVMCTVYTNTFIVSQLEVEIGSLNNAAKHNILIQ